MNGGVSKPGGLPFFPGRVLISRTLSGLFLVGGNHQVLNRPRKKTSTPRENLGKFGKILKNSGMSYKRQKGKTSPDCGAGTEPKNP